MSPATSTAGASMSSELADLDECAMDAMDVAQKIKTKHYRDPRVMLDSEKPRRRVRLHLARRACALDRRQRRRGAPRPSCAKSRWPKPSVRAEEMMVACQRTT